jgi:membrane-bound serine protease (ClpP class)
LRTLFVSLAVFLLTHPLCAKVLQADISGIVHPVTADVISNTFSQAEREHADAVLIRIGTPGGFLDATRDIVEKVLHSPVPVIMWVGPSGARAASAGFFILESADVAAMAPGTNTGASHPVLDGGGAMDAVMKQKVENDAAALMRSVVTRRGRNEQAAEKTVRESVSYTDREALDLHLIELIAADPPALLKQLEGREITRFDGRKQTLHFADGLIEQYRPSLKQRIMLAIADPNIALLLLVTGALCMYIEFSSPGLVAPGVIGAIAVLLALSALSLFPIDWLGAALMILALAFFILEAKFATHGILTTGGAIAMLLGAMMLIDTSSPELRIRLGTALALTVPFALITSFILSLAMRARRNKVTTGIEGMIGQPAIAAGELNPAGTVKIHGEYWNARAAGHVSANARVRVARIDGLTLYVEPLAAEADKEK